MGRLFFIAFLGKPNGHGAEEARESSWTMVISLVVLAIFSIGGGYMVLYPEALQEVLYNWVPHPHGADHKLMIIISAVASLSGLVLAYFLYAAGTASDNLEKAVPPVYGIAKSRFYFDELYNGYVRIVQDRIADIIHFSIHSSSPTCLSGDLPAWSWAC